MKHPALVLFCVCTAAAQTQVDWSQIKNKPSFVSANNAVVNNSLTVLSTSDAFLIANGSGLAGTGNLLLTGNNSSNCWNLKADAGNSLVVAWSPSCSGPYSLTTEATYTPGSVTFEQEVIGHGGFNVGGINSYGLTSAGVPKVASCTGCGGGGTGTAPLTFTGLASNPALSLAGNANLYFNTTTGQFSASYSGGPYTGLRTPTLAVGSAGFAVDGSGNLATPGLITASSGLYITGGSFGLSGSGVLNVASCTGCGGGGGGGTPAGPNNSIQTNAGGGNFGGSANLTYTGGTVNLSQTSNSAEGFHVVQNGTFVAVFAENNGTNATAEFRNDSTGPGLQALTNGGTSAATFSVIGGGTCDIEPVNTALVCSSDERLKKNDMAIDSAVATLMKLKPLTFAWNNENETQGRHSGFFAQDVAGVLPDLVSQDKAGYYQLNQTGLIPYLVKAIQEQSAEIDRLRSLVGLRPVRIGR